MHRIRFGITIITIFLICSTFIFSGLSFPILRPPYLASLMPRASANSSLNSPWPMFQHDPQHTSRSPFVGASTNSTEWVFGSIGAIYSSPVIDGHGILYVTSSDRNLYALNEDGSINWTSHIGEPAYTPALGLNGTIYVPALNHVYSFYLNGSLEWSVNTSEENVGAPLAVSSSGIIYSVNSGTVYAINPDGKVAWKVSTTCTLSSPAIGPDGKIYCGGGGKFMNDYLYAINPEGTFAWNYFTGKGINTSIITSPTIGSDGSVYFVTFAGTLYSLTPVGALNWKIQRLGQTESAPIIGSNETIIVAGTNLTAVSPNGTSIWSKNCFVSSNSSGCLPIGPVGGMAIDANRTIFLGQNLSSGSSLLALSSTNGSFEWGYSPLQSNEAIYSSPSIGANGQVFFGSVAKCATCGGNLVGHFYSVGRLQDEYPVNAIESGLPLNTPWSMSFDGRTRSATDNIMIFSAGQGLHSWNASDATNSSIQGIRFAPSPSSGSINISSAVSIPITYQKLYEVFIQVTPSGSGITNSTYDNWYFAPTEIGLAATNTSQDYKFGYWTSSSAEITIANPLSAQTSALINGTGSISAVFYPRLSINAETGGSVSYSYLAASGSVQGGSTTNLYLSGGSFVRLSAIPGPGYSFTEWDGVPAQLSNLQTINYQVIGPSNVSAIFVSSITTSSSTSSTTTSSSFSRSLSFTSTTTSSNSNTTSSYQSFSIFDYPQILLIGVVSVLLTAVGSIMVRRRRLLK